MQTLERLILYRLEVPLTAPYKLAFGSVKAFETLIAEAIDSDGRRGYGEATLLTGYTEETITGSWQLAQTWAARMIGQPIAQAKRLAETWIREAPFTATALITAIEMLESHPLLVLATPARVPVLGLVNGTEPQALAAEIEALLAQGFSTLKIKVGFDPEQDAKKVALIQKLNRGRARLRIDANQGYTADEGRRFAASLEPSDIELFEQPCAAGDWAAAKAVAEVSPVPMMLDESIYGLEDIERAAQLGAARYIKLKLMKMGSLDRLKAGIERIRALGMEPVLGNGVAGEIGCWMEACVACRLIDNAGEMNGFLKPVARLLENPLGFEGGAIVLPSGYVPRLNAEAVARFTRAKVSFTPKARASV